jgi:hypothetical protein
VRARLLEQRVDEGKVELPLGGFELLPRDRHQQRVGADPLDGGPHRVEHCR